MDQARHPSSSDTLEQPSGLWSSFIAAREDEEYYTSWLALVSQQIRGSIQSLLVLSVKSGTTEQFHPVALWPQRENETNDPTIFQEVLEKVIEERCGLLLELESGNCYTVAYPLIIDENIYGITALELQAENEDDLKDAMEKLQWGSSWLELLNRRKQNYEDRILLKRLKAAVDMLSVTLENENFITAAMAFTTEMAAATGCERVSLGFNRNNHMRLQAVSHSVEVGEKMNLTRSIERVMDEAVQQRSEVRYPEIDGDSMLISREHEALSRQQAMAAVSTFPIFSGGRYFAALTCERGAENPFTEEDLEFIRGVVALAGPAMESKYINDRPVISKIWQGGRDLLSKVVGRHYLGGKLFLFLVCGIVLFMSLTRGEYRVTADTSLEGAVQRAIVVPFDGYIDKAFAKAGDLVKEEQLLCSLDSRDLYLEKLAKKSKYRQLERQYQETVAKHDRARSGIIRAQLEQYQAELDLLDSKLDRTNLLSPFDGLLVSGDLSQRLGNAVKQGEVLFEVTPLNAYRVIVKVDERRIADVKPGQRGNLVLSSLPDKQYRFTVKKITPLTTAEEGRNYFRVEAYLDHIDNDLRPGMEGVGKISVDQRRLLAIWTRDLVDWTKVKAWAWLP